MNLLLPPPRPNKHRGQHFLIDKNVVNKMIALADVHPNETVLEIGPGRGCLTGSLCQDAAHVLALEVDTALVQYLNARFKDRTNVEIRETDALKFSYRSLPSKTVIVANLPYYIASPLLFKFFEARDNIDRMVLMLQLEVAQRMVAAPGTKQYGILSVLTQYFTKPRLSFKVSRSCFRPSPDVTSAVVRLDMVSDPYRVKEEAEWVVKTVRSAFSHRRKTLFNSFRTIGLSPSLITQALDGAQIHGGRRAETLTLQEFRDLASVWQQLAVSPSRVIPFPGSSTVPLPGS